MLSFRRNYLLFQTNLFDCINIFRKSHMIDDLINRSLAKFTSLKPHGKDDDDDDGELVVLL